MVAYGFDEGFMSPRPLRRVPSIPRLSRRYRLPRRSSEMSSNVKRSPHAKAWSCTSPTLRSTLHTNWRSSGPRSPPSGSRFACRRGGLELYQRLGRTPSRLCAARPRSPPRPRSAAASRCRPGRADPSGTAPPRAAFSRKLSKISRPVPSRLPAARPLLRAVGQHHAARGYGRARHREGDRQRTKPWRRALRTLASMGRSTRPLHRWRAYSFRRDRRAAGPPADDGSSPAFRASRAAAGGSGSLVYTPRRAARVLPDSAFPAPARAQVSRAGRPRAASRARCGLGAATLPPAGAAGWKRRIDRLPRTSRPRREARSPRGARFRVRGRDARRRARAASRSRTSRSTRVHCLGVAFHFGAQGRRDFWRETACFAFRAAVLVYFVWRERPQAMSVDAKRCARHLVLLEFEPLEGYRATPGGARLR